MGDPAGVGPEVVIGALARRSLREECRALVIGDSRGLARAAGAAGRRFRPRVVASAEEADGCTSAVCLLDLANAAPDEIATAEVSAAAGQAAAAYIRQAVELAQVGTVSGIVTAPISKEALQLAGVTHPGHTEMLASLCGVRHVAMMLVHGEMRVSHVTGHVSVRKACDLVSQARVLTVIRLTHQALRGMGLAVPRIAVAGLNPHAGESGLFGDEEARAIAPAVKRARGEGMEVTGPLPPDSVFARHRAGEFDAVVAMTHDQGHIAVKTVGFAAKRGGGLKSAGVNVTLGLPIIRTSVDHGTAFDIAGQGVADPTSMVAAIRLAAHMARRRAR
jgi:4-hydroxythreonine-4-phosphate dehydrogenase